MTNLETLNLSLGLISRGLSRSKNNFVKLIPRMLCIEDIDLILIHANHA